MALEDVGADLGPFPPTGEAVGLQHVCPPGETGVRAPGCGLGSGEECVLSADTTVTWEDKSGRGQSTVSHSREGPSPGGGREGCGPAGRQPEAGRSQASSWGRWSPSGEVTRGGGCPWAVLGRQGGLATREGERPRPRRLSVALPACWLQLCPRRAFPGTSRFPLDPSCPGAAPGRPSSLEPLRAGFHVTFTSPPGEGSRLQATAIAFLWPRGARRAPVVACHVLLWEAKRAIVSPFSPAGHIPAALPWALGCGCAVSLVTCPAGY